MHEIMSKFEWSQTRISRIFLKGYAKLVYGTNSVFVERMSK